MKFNEASIFGLVCAAAIGLGSCVGLAFVTNKQMQRMSMRIEQIHVHTCRLEAKLDYPTTPDCPPAPEDDR